MQLNHIVAAVDRSEEGRSALGAALTLAEHSTGRVTALRVEPPISGSRPVEDLVDPLGSNPSPRTVSQRSTYEKAFRYGLPGVEIGRFAEEAGAGLVVLGRKQRSTTQRLLLGDTADEAVRRSQLPCLSVRAGTNQEFTTVLAALDGSARGMAVLLAALDLSR
ncbi:MAG TPA: universal stress protein, partial [Gemmatimonadales bacterium]|nr:universal stress protein [Gemmatimonadales bacterium]